MELIVGFNLSSYSHCTSYTRLTTDTGNCCRACGWPFIKSTHIVILKSGLLLTEFFHKCLIVRKGYFHQESIILNVIATKKFMYNWNSNPSFKNPTIRYVRMYVYYHLLAY